MGKSKKRNGFLKPNTELPPNRISETSICGSSMSGMSCIAVQAAGASGAGHFVSGSESWRTLNAFRFAFLHNNVDCAHMESTSFGQLGKLGIFNSKFDSNVRLMHFWLNLKRRYSRRLRSGVGPEGSYHARARNARDGVAPGQSGAPSHSPRARLLRVAPLRRVAESWERAKF